MGRRIGPGAIYGLTNAISRGPSGKWSWPNRQEKNWGSGRRGPVREIGGPLRAAPSGPCRGSAWGLGREAWASGSIGGYRYPPQGARSAVEISAVRMRWRSPHERRWITNRLNGPRVAVHGHAPLRAGWRLLLLVGKSLKRGRAPSVQPAGPLPWGQMAEGARAGPRTGPEPPAPSPLLRGHFSPP